MDDHRQQSQTLLHSYVSILAERHGMGPGKGFEYRLWDALVSSAPSRLISADERDELRFLVDTSERWVSFDVETGELHLMPLDDWRALLAKRGH